MTAKEPSIRFTEERGALSRTSLITPSEVDLLSLFGFVNTV